MAENIDDSRDEHAPVQRTVQRSASSDDAEAARADRPSGTNSTDDGAAAGARHQAWCTAPIPPGASRCPRCGVWQMANRGALVAGQHSAQFWREADETRRAIVESVITSAGHTTENAPRTLTIAAEALAQATLLRDAAFARIVEAGGPLTSADRARRAFNVWESASAAVERYLRLFGRAKVNTERVPTLDEWLAEGDDSAAPKS